MEFSFSPLLGILGAAILGGAIGLQLLLDCPARISRAAVVCGAAKFSEPEMWHARARLVRSGGTAAVVETARDLWFASGFTDLQPDIALAFAQRNIVARHSPDLESGVRQRGQGGAQYQQRHAVTTHRGRFHYL